MENGRFVDDLVQIVGVVADVKYAAISGAAEPILYMPFSQSFTPRASIIVATADGAPERRTAAFEAALHGVEPGIPVESKPLSTVVAASIERQRLGMWLMTGFGLVALALATVGMFGVIQYVVSQRIGEIAIRQALGATRGAVIADLMADGMRAAAVGLAGGLLLAWWMGRLLAGYVFEVAARDPIVLGGSVAAVAAAAILATLVPASRAAAFDLSNALRRD
jgi:putative ABC transport system permease protein